MRLDAVDVALTEAAIGGGLTGVLLFGAAARLRGTGRGRHDERPACTCVVAAVLCASDRGWARCRPLLLPDPAPTLAPAAARIWRQPGSATPSPACSWHSARMDTMLEKVVLLLALVGVWSLASDQAGAVARTAPPGRSDGVLPSLRALLPPAGIVVGIYISGTAPITRAAHFRAARFSQRCGCWSSWPGWRIHPPMSSRWLRLILVAGPACSSPSALAGFALAAAFLAYPVAFAKPLILAIEVAMIADDRGDARPAARRRAETERRAMSARDGVRTVRAPRRSDSGSTA